MTTNHNIKEKLANLADCHISERPDGKIIVTPIIAPSYQEQPVHFTLIKKNNKYILSDNYTWCSTIHLNHIAEEYSHLSYVKKADAIIHLFDNYNLINIENTSTDKSFIITTIPVDESQLKHVCKQLVKATQELYDLLGE